VCIPPSAFDEEQPTLSAHRIECVVGGTKLRVRMASLVMLISILDRCQPSTSDPSPQVWTVLMRQPSSRSGIAPASHIGLRRSTPTPQSRFTRASSLPTALDYGYQTIEELRRPLPEAHVRGDSIHQAHVGGGFIHHTAVIAENEGFLGLGLGPPTHEADTPSVAASYIVSTHTLLERNTT
jgi:hypothetical protein